MRYSQLFPKAKREAPKGAVTANHKLLVRAGFIDQLMAGSWTLLPMGWRVVTKINTIIREELDAIGCQEMLMPLMHPKEIWNETGRWESAAEVMYQLKDSRKKEFALSFTHEEIVMDLARKHVTSYRDLPLAVYHFSTKFRNETRPQGGILRGREFLMKDLYSLHASEADLVAFYEKVSEAYLQIFKRHEAYNKEIFAGEETKFEARRAIEVGNIFPFGDKKYAEKMGGYFRDKDGVKKLMHFASYGIGTTRVMGAVVEVYHDDKGIIWPESVAPYQVHLVTLENQEPGSRKQGEKVYTLLSGAGIEVLYDETQRSAGEKFADADLIGIPVRLVVSDKTRDRVEWKNRDEEGTEILEVDEVIRRLV
ncbi:MAG: Prolyl-tRNA synthetase [Candidatus Amesbacteria bacterium GW2011_GWA2_47_11]|uniref:Proline--tRNA ligase n=1 Tax=Candidatus Amesbacteria bacterium GW2011_GWA2_47_11 TaxID=1618357 RepID=A0A0G1RD08_9BACT|nr:MAG: Prolyl-tRNA synthetase [Candidatus Amesbacteria bacterium GW2011_GWA2_47_11]